MMEGLDRMPQRQFWLAVSRVCILEYVFCVMVLCCHGVVLGGPLSLVLTLRGGLLRG
jgi:hypothetical protein